MDINDIHNDVRAFWDTLSEKRKLRAQLPPPSSPKIISETQVMTQNELAELLRKEPGAQVIDLVSPNSNGQPVQ
jgi:hypothetical protein